MSSNSSKVPLGNVSKKCKSYGKVIAFLFKVQNQGTTYKLSAVYISCHHLYTYIILLLIRLLSNETIILLA